MSHWSRSRETELKHRRFGAVRLGSSGFGPAAVGLATIILTDYLFMVARMSGAYGDRSRNGKARSSRRPVPAEGDSAQYAVSYGDAICSKCGRKGILKTQMRKYR